MRLISLLLLVCCNFSNSYGYDGCNNNIIATSAGPLVITSAGPVIGEYLNVLHNEVAAFLGIPYALPPVAEKRFLKPFPLHHWEGILNAKIEPRPCMQYSSRIYPWIPPKFPKPSEDCLYLNVWIPTKYCSSTLEKMPVLVWIYGGRFVSGSISLDLYNGSILASRNKAIIVSINYRLGMFGFLKSGWKEAPGNVGLLDQNLALKWIKKNIVYFGGDANDITLMGESAGSMSISLHMVSPMSKKLFNRAILQSGTAYHPLLVDSPEAAYEKANLYAKLINCNFTNSRIESDLKIMECIKSKSSEELAKFDYIFSSKLSKRFVPSYEDEFLPFSPLHAIKEGDITPINILIGNNKNEGTILLNFLLPDLFRLYSEPLLNRAMARKIIERLFITVERPSAEDIYQYYFQNVSSNASGTELARLIADAYGDFILTCPTQFFAEKVANAYFYYLTYRSSSDGKAEWLGVHHFYDVPLVFGAPLREAKAYNSEDGIFSENIMEKWLTFVQTGYPLGDHYPEKWPLFEVDEHLSYELNPKREGILKFPRSDACEFWRPYLECDVPPAKNTCQ